MIKTVTTFLILILALRAFAAEPTTYSVILGSARPNQIIHLQTHLLVPLLPSPSGTLFLWPGLQPGDNEDGVLQPVLTWGPSCSPGDKPSSYSTWWVSGQYVNLKDQLPNLSKCNGGNVMAAQPGDDLYMDMTLVGTIWMQKVTNLKSGETVHYEIDLSGQKMNFAYFVIEEWGAQPRSKVIFTNTTITFQNPDSSSCKFIKNQAQASVPRATQGGSECMIDSMMISDPSVGEP